MKKQSQPPQSPNGTLFPPTANADPSTAPVPFSSYWFPDTLLQWAPNADYNAPFNVVRVRLTQRVANSKTQLNPQQGALFNVAGYYGQVTSNQPSQGTRGAAAATVFSFPFWQYINFYQYWAGSAGEGLIVPPAPYWVAAGHRNGVPVLGIVFFPPNEDGGKICWVNQFLQQNVDGSFPIADKLIQVAQTYGFDGWFINQETACGNPTTGTLMQAFMEYYEKTKPAGMYLVWYDAMLPDGEINYQNALNVDNSLFFQNGSERISDQFFANYRWTQSGAQASAQEAQNLGRSPYEVQMGVYLPWGQSSYQKQLSDVFPNGVNDSPITGVALFNVFHATFNKQNTFDQNYQLALSFWTAGYDWVLQRGADNPWAGIGYYTPARAIVSGDGVFLSRFNVGQGTEFFIDGRPQDFGAWWDVSAQDILPTWAGLNADAGVGSEIGATYNRAIAYNGGSSLQLAGSTDRQRNATIYLYKTAIPIVSDSELTVTWYADEMEQASLFSLVLHMQIENGPLTQQYFPVRPSTLAGWNTDNFGLGSFEGQSVVEIDIVITAPTNTYVQILLGEIGVRDAQFPKPTTVTNFKVAQHYIYNDSNGPAANLNLSWDLPTDYDKIWYFDLWRKASTNDQLDTFLGRTSNNIYNIQALRKNGKNATTFSICPVNINGDKGSTSTATFMW